jgi:hypothetical protein
MHPKINGGDHISYDDAVTEGRNIIRKMEGEQRRSQMRLGELAARIEPKYRDRTVAKFAKAINVSDCTLKRYRSVYKAWDGNGIVAPGPVSYAVLRELQNHPQRQEIVEQNPQITKREAQRLRREYEEKQREGTKKKGKSGDWKKDENKRWLRRVQILANDIKRAAAGVVVTPAILEILEPELLPDLKEGGAALLKLAAQLESLDKQLKKAKRKAPDLKEAEREGVAA